MLINQLAISITYGVLILQWCKNVSFDFIVSFTFWTFSSAEVLVSKGGLHEECGNRGLAPVARFCPNLGAGTRNLAATDVSLGDNDRLISLAPTQANSLVARLTRCRKQQSRVLSNGILATSHSNIQSSSLYVLAKEIN
jgi:hypothetical protein